MRRTHTHRCKTCDAPIPCRGARVDNYDGWPEVLCAYETDPGFDGFVCEDCATDADIDAVLLIEKVAL